ncbi:copper resistance protein CopC [Rhodococcus qingshengii]|uniref:Copper resistance protein CopC n=1 Tax=Rhodococcus baikonurensis TaxID=172041 RepID=A0ABV5XVA8_9NOCA|nr:MULTISPECIES: copper resistance protein CopC [Rhodococcus]MBP1054352.1 copper resistance protein CopC [Rhodococcus qingshengii]
MRFWELASQTHPTLLITEPGSETAVSEPPRTITLIFNEQVTPQIDAIKVLDDAGRESPMRQSHPRAAPQSLPGSRRLRRRAPTPSGGK